MQRANELLVEREDDYRIRRARPEDGDEILELYQSVLDPAFSSEWFQWKYRENPYADRIPIVVGTHAGDVVGAGGFVPVRMHTGYRSVLAVQPCDAAVDPAHRRNGVYTDILGAGLDRFADDGAAFAFDFPNALSRAAFENHGWNAVTTREEFVRPQHPSALLDGPELPVLDPLCRLGAEAYGRLRQLSGPRSRRTEHDVVRVSGVPSHRLAALHRKCRPTGIHAERSPTYFDWRFENPLARYTTYVAVRDGVALAAIIAGRKSTAGATVTYLTDVIPLGDHPERPPALAAIVEVIASEHADADLLVAPGSAFPRSVLESVGFLSDRRLPLSIVSDDTVHGAKALALPSNRIDGHDLHDPASWSITFAEYDTP